MAEASASDDAMSVMKGNPRDLFPAEGPAISQSQQMVTGSEEGAGGAQSPLSHLGKRSLHDAKLQVHHLCHAHDDHLNLESG